MSSNIGKLRWDIIAALALLGLIFIPILVMVKNSMSQSRERTLQLVAALEGVCLEQVDYEMVKALDVQSVRANGDLWVKTDKGDFLAIGEICDGSTPIVGGITELFPPGATLVVAYRRASLRGSPVRVATLVIQVSEGRDAKVQQLLQKGSFTREQLENAAGATIPPI